MKDLRCCTVLKQLNLLFCLSRIKKKGLCLCAHCSVLGHAAKGKKHNCAVHLRRDPSAKEDKEICKAIDASLYACFSIG